MIKLDLRAAIFQFRSRAVFYLVILALVAVSLVIAQLIERSRFGAWLIAVRENEDAAQALGVNATAVKLGAMMLSAAITAAAGCFYAQYFLFVDAGIALWHLDLDRGAADADHRRRRHGVRAAARRAGGEIARRRRQARDRRCPRCSI